MNDTKLSRRIFLMGSTAVAMGGCATGGTRKPLRSLQSRGYKSPNEIVNIASVGAGGKAGDDIRSMPKEFVRFVALCDPDQTNRGVIQTFGENPDATQYADFRVMLEKEKDNIDAVIVSTPDHCHAVAAATAMRLGKHVYVQKPLTRTVWEARRLTEIAREMKVATQMGNQGHSGEGVRKTCEAVWSGAIGNVTEVHAWTNRPIWPQGIAEPLPAQDVPEDMAWDIWLGPAPYRPYNRGYAPFNWRGWFDYGTGALGDMACHILDPANWALKLTAPVSVECIKIEGKNDQTYPNKSIVRFEFPQRGTMPPVTLYWYDGGLLPPRPEGLPANEELGEGDNGSLFIGDKGMMTQDTYGGNTRLLPKATMDGYTFPNELLPRSPENNHYQDWIRACKGEAPACSNFDYSGPFTEWIVMAVIALRVPGKLYWDSKNLKFLNSKEANDLVKSEYRKGWDLV